MCGSLRSLGGIERQQIFVDGPPQPPAQRLRQCRGAGFDSELGRLVDDGEQALLVEPAFLLGDLEASLQEIGKPGDLGCDQASSAEPTVQEHAHLVIDGDEDVMWHV